ncbi:baseplate J/gp47 family protein [Pelotomaculum propionicicum]|uniref:Uncharacterized protein n=1 Tax=Pelotomaculum propionicicum TaxID=258475 RepID=A0A4Y7RJY4_9FIRM|nr:baseplate J/gp47 family protein [Pelotomaculum propionicicum]TEB09295.1 hypothetical protein Pmgp_03227 [Pelotomaculum propionicicum]
MTEPNFKDFNQILSDMMADLSAKGTKLTDLNPGSVIRTLLEVNAAKLEESHYLAEQIINLFFASTTFGKYLDRRAAEKGVKRELGTAATGIVTATRSTPAPFGQFIPKDTTFETEDRTVQIITTADANLDQGATSVNLHVKAVNVGKAGNLQAGTVLKQVGVAVSLIEAVTVAEPGLKDGTDPETDDDLRNKYLAVMRSPGTSGNKADYVKWALEVAGVGGVYVDPLWSGRGTVKVSLLGTDKTPAAQAIVDAVQAYIDPNPGLGEGKAPIGATVTCVAAPAVSIDIAATVVLDGSKTLVEVQAAFAAAVVEHLKTIAYSKDTTVRYSRMESLLLDTQGVTDYSNVLVNGGAANIVIPAGSVAVKGTVTLS